MKHLRLLGQFRQAIIGRSTESDLNVFVRTSIALKLLNVSDTSGPNFHPFESPVVAIHPILSQNVALWLNEAFL